MSNFGGARGGGKIKHLAAAVICSTCKERDRRPGQRTCLICHRADQRQRRARTISTVLPDEFESWPIGKQEKWLMGWMRKAVASKSSVPRGANDPSTA